jgi:hypothetical protein
VSGTLDRGARVVVEMTTNDAFPWQRGPRFEAVLKARPAGPGDTFLLSVEGVGEVALNGNSAAFVGMWPWRPRWREALGRG